jgi:GxxExxY protein
VEVDGKGSTDAGGWQIAKDKAENRLPQKGARVAKGMKTEKEIFTLVDKIREISYELHGYLRHGHLEKVYENGIVHRGRKAGIQIEQQYPLKVHDVDGEVLGDYKADLFAEKCLLIELKAVKRLSDEHTAQILGYMRACRVEHGLLINFGAPRFEIRKYILSNIS